MGQAARDWWATVARLNHLKISGYNLYVVFSTGKDPSSLDALKLPP